MSNPMFKNLDNQRVDALDDSKATISGTVNKTSILFVILAIVAFYVWDLCSKGFSDKVNLIMIISAVSGLILALITSFKPNVSAITAPIYAICEGALVGGISYAYNSFYNGVVVNAVSLTILCMLLMLFLYKTKIIRMTEKLRTIILTSTIAVAIFYGVIFIASLFGIQTHVFGTPVGIGISALICVIACFNYLVDFDIIERTTQDNMPKYFEWYNGFALMVTTVWLYLELLRLLAQLNRRN